MSSGPAFVYIVLPRKPELYIIQRLTVYGSVYIYIKKLCRARNKDIKIMFKQGVVIHTFDPSTQTAKTGGLPIGYFVTAKVSLDINRETIKTKLDLHLESD